MNHEMYLGRLESVVEKFRIHIANMRPVALIRSIPSVGIKSVSKGVV